VRVGFFLSLFGSIHQPGFRDDLFEKVERGEGKNPQH
jgi:hypothetical protein